MKQNYVLTLFSVAVRLHFIQSKYCCRCDVMVPRLSIFSVTPPANASCHRSRSFLTPRCPFLVYHAIYLEELTATELIEKIAQLFNISPRQINQIFKQGPTGIHVLVSDEVRFSTKNISRATNQTNPISIGANQASETTLAFLLARHVWR